MTHSRERTNANYRGRPGLLASLLLAAVLPVGGHAAEGEVLYQWVQLIPDPESADGPLVAPAGLIRAVLEGQDQEPPNVFYRAAAGNRLLDCGPMTVRYAGDSMFPVTVVEHVVPAGGTYRIGADGEKVRLPGLDGAGRGDDRFVVIGDTGCRGKPRQSCDSPEQWPFQYIAAAVAEIGPDLVIHVGDYVYQGGYTYQGPLTETAGWEYWEQEFFRPAREVLKQSLWLMVRGNHENYARNSGIGWFVFLDPTPATLSSLKLYDYQWDKDLRHTRPYAVDLYEDHRLIVVDSANSNGDHDPGAEDRSNEDLARVGELARARAGVRTWMVSHVPIDSWNELDHYYRPVPFGEATETMRAAEAANPLPSNVEAVISGDLHLFEYLKPAAGVERPLQLVVGNGGVELDPVYRRLGPRDHEMLQGWVRFDGRSQRAGASSAAGWRGLAWSEFGFVEIAYERAAGDYAFHLWLARNADKTEYERQPDQSLVRLNEP